LRGHCDQAFDGCSRAGRLPFCGQRSGGRELSDDAVARAGFYLGGTLGRGWGNATQTTTGTVTSATFGMSGGIVGVVVGHLRVALTKKLP
jgi:hypothetical protein